MPKILNNFSKPDNIRRTCQRLNQQTCLIKTLAFLIVTMLFTTGCQKRNNPEMPDGASIPALVRKSNVVYDSASFQTGYMHIPPYIANGILGGCFDHMGFQSMPNKGVPNGRTVLGYIRHYYQHKPTTRQAQLPLAVIQAEFADGSSVYNMMEARNYRQELDIYSGVLTTEYDLFGPTKITAFAHQTIPNLFILKIDRQAISPGKEMVLKINCQTAVTQQTGIAWPPGPVNLSFETMGNRADITSSTNMVDTRWTVEGNNPINVSGENLLIHLKENENLVKIFIHRSDVDESAESGKSFNELLDLHTQKWAESWQRSWIDFPEERIHHIWNRANYYNLSNFPSIHEKALIPTGMNANIWGFTFPQDVYYVQENLLRSGHFDLYKKAMKYWLDILPEVKKYSLRVMDVEGGFYPWTPPFAKWDEFEKDSVVGNDSYEIHNPAYISAMVWHYYKHTGDLEFLKNYFPIMEEVWRFYSNVIHPNERGTFDVNHHKAAGQDEASRLSSSKNLLCASYSAEYSMRNYLRAAQLTGQFDPNLFERAQTIQKAGLERNTLLNENGYYVTYEGDNRPPNSQKHPVQLNAITFCPMPDKGNATPSKTAWEKRYDLTVQARKPISHGWTYAAFALSSSRLGQPDGLESDLNAAQYCAHADPRWIQFYEFTFWERYTLHTAYYFPTHGLYQQALTDALVQDWQGFTDIFACMLPGWKDKRFAFKGIYTSGGVSVDGVWDNGKFRITLYPNGAEKLDIRVSEGQSDVKVKNDKNGLKSFNPGEIVTIGFEASEPVILERRD